MNHINIAEHLQQLEEELLRPDVRANADRIAHLLADDFREFGASGHLYDKTSVIAQLAHEQPCTLSLTDFACQQLTPEIALVTYRAQRTDANGTRESLRSSLWVLRDGRWQVLFHQGTRI